MRTKKSLQLAILGVLVVLILGVYILSVQTGAPKVDGSTLDAASKAAHEAPPPEQVDAAVPVKPMRATPMSN